MRIRAVLILEEVAEKILRKHGITKEAAAEVFEDRPIFRRAAGIQYSALGQAESGRILAVLFTYDAISKKAWVTTAYPATPRQTRWYRNTRK